MSGYSSLWYEHQCRLCFISSQPTKRYHFRLKGATRSTTSSRLRNSIFAFARQASTHLQLPLVRNLSHFIPFFLSLSSRRTPRRTPRRASAPCATRHTTLSSKRSFVREEHPLAATFPPNTERHSAGNEEIEVCPKFALRRDFISVACGAEAHAHVHITRVPCASSNEEGLATAQCATDEEGLLAAASRSKA